MSELKRYDPYKDPHGWSSGTHYINILSKPQEVVDE